MAKVNKTILKSYFESGDVPNQSQYVDLIDSQLNVAETTAQTVAGAVTSSIVASLFVKSKITLLKLVTISLATRLLYLFKSIDCL